ncbi:hypothetical protein AB6809_29570 [Paraburkholderia sp. RCC_158]|uniref:hypothetical protein n=1 Tax=Paraburkholderia sp. RCC_158 TaxID=3239220 RepID=UPI0035237C4F
MTTKTTSRARNTKKTAATTVDVKMLGASEASAAMDPQIAALLDVLGEGGNLPAFETIEGSAAPIVESSDVIEQATVETLDVAPQLPALPEEIVLPAELLDAPVAPSDEALSAAIAGLEVSEHYALVPADAAPHDALTDEEAEKERLLAEENLVNDAAVEDATAAEPAAAKPARAPRTHYQNKTDRIKARLGAKLGDYLVLELDDALLEGDALKAKQDETLAVIDAMSVKVKNRASLLMDWLSGKTGKPNEILKRALDVLAADGKITTGDNGNLHKNLIAKPYSPSAARAMGRNTVTVMEKTKMIVAGATKGEYLPNPASLFLVMAQQLTGAEPVAEEPAVETPAPVVEEPAVETTEETAAE